MRFIAGFRHCVTHSSAFPYGQAESFALFHQGKETLGAGTALSAFASSSFREIASYNYTFTLSFNGDLKQYKHIFYFNLLFLRLYLALNKLEYKYYEI